MRILIDIGHPAHVHYFRNMANELIDRGHRILFTARRKDVAIDLLDHYGFDYRIIGSAQKSTLRKLLGLFTTTIKLFFISLRFKPDVLLNASPSAAFVAWITCKTHISLEDTFNLEQVRLYLPFTDVVLTGDYPHISLGKKETRYPGYQELAYLHPRVFSPDPTVIDDLGVKESQKYAIVRFVAWAATHDSGHSGVSLVNKINLVNRLSKHMKVFISSESELPKELKQYKIMIKPEKMHSALYYADLFFGESATMASECACLGTPAIFLDNTGRAYTLDQQVSHSLVYNYTESDQDQIEAIDQALCLAQNDDAKAVHLERSRKMMNTKIDLTAFLVWFVVNCKDKKTTIRNKNIDFSQFITEFKE